VSINFIAVQCKKSFVCCNTYPGDLHWVGCYCYKSRALCRLLTCSPTRDGSLLTLYLACPCLHSTSHSTSHSSFFIIDFWVSGVTHGLAESSKTKLEGHWYVLTGQSHFMLPNYHCQSTEGNSVSISSQWGNSPPNLNHSLILCQNRCQSLTTITKEVITTHIYGFMITKPPWIVLKTSIQKLLNSEKLTFFCSEEMFRVLYVLAVGW